MTLPAEPGDPSPIPIINKPVHEQARLNPPPAPYPAAEFAAELGPQTTASTGRFPHAVR